jgi:serine/threonine protein kinase
VLGYVLEPNAPLCIVSELIAGGSLLSVLQQTGEWKTKTHVFNFALDIAMGMHHLHVSFVVSDKYQMNNILHCDLAARNVLCAEMSGSFRLKITDFGLSHQSERNEIYSKQAIPVR